MPTAPMLPPDQMKAAGAPPTNPLNFLMAAAEAHSAGVLTPTQEKASEKGFRTMLVGDYEMPQFGTTKDYTPKRDRLEVVK